MADPEEASEGWWPRTKCSWWNEKLDELRYCKHGQRDHHFIEFWEIWGIWARSLTVRTKSTNFSSKFGVISDPPKAPSMLRAATASPTRASTRPSSTGWAVNHPVGQGHFSSFPKSVGRGKQRNHLVRPATCCKMHFGEAGLLFEDTFSLNTPFVSLCWYIRVCLNIS